jgi:hypothetical protein
MHVVDRHFECNAPGVIFERFEDETVVINLDTGHYYTLDSVGAIIWTRIEEGVGVEAIVAEFQEDFSGELSVIEDAVRGFVSLMVVEQLIRPRVDGHAAGRERVRKPKVPFRAPEVGKYNDMAEMLLLDPVHDVDGAGWPSAAPANRPVTSTRVQEDDVSEWPELKRGR